MVLVVAVTPGPRMTLEVKGAVKLKNRTYRSLTGHCWPVGLHRQPTATGHAKRSVARVATQKLERWRTLVRPWNKIYMANSGKLFLRPHVPQCERGVAKLN